MGPKQTAEYLRQIASKIEKSKSPDKNLVVRDLKWVVANMGNVGEEQQQQQAQQEGYGQQQQEALPQSSGGKQMLNKFLEDAKKALESGDDAGFKANLEKALKHG